MNKTDTISNLKKRTISSVKNRSFIGLRFGRLKVIDNAVPLLRANDKKRRRYLCLCDCGNETIVLRDNLAKRNTTSCGCYHSEMASQKNIIHGYSSKNSGHLETWQIWRGMLRRCYDPKYIYYSYYGGRGIIVCDRWKENFANFLEDMGERPSRLTLDRYPNRNGNYEPGNCRWATRKEQSNNTSQNHIIYYKEQSYNITQFCDKYHIPRNSFLRLYKIKRLSPEQIVERYNTKLAKAYEKWSKK